MIAAVVGIARAFGLIIQRPFKSTAGSRAQQRSDPRIRCAPLPSPRGNASLDARILHVCDVLLDDGQARRIIDSQARVVVRKRVDTALRPSFREPRIIECQSQRQGQRVSNRSGCSSRGGRPGERQRAGHARSRWSCSPAWRRRDLHGRRARRPGAGRPCNDQPRRQAGAFFVGVIHDAIAVRRNDIEVDHRFSGDGPRQVCGHGRIWLKPGCVVRRPIRPLEEPWSKSPYFQPMFRSLR